MKLYACVMLQPQAKCNVFFVYIVDPSKETAFKVAPSKWEAVDEAELESQGESFRRQIILM